MQAVFALVCLGLSAWSMAIPMQGSDPSNSKSVIIVGSGFAGLGAAQTLQAKGYSVTILEGDTRFGGRAYSENTTFGQWVEHGAEWIHGIKHNPITDLANKYKCSGLTTDYDDEDVYTDTGEKITDYISDHIDKDLEKIYKAVDYCSYSDTDISLEAGVQKAMSDLKLDQLHMERYRFELEQEIVDDYSAPLANMSCWYWDCDDSLHGGDWLLNEGGYTTIIDGLVNDIGVSNFHLNTTVTEVDHSILHGATVKTSDGRTFTASYVIVTVSLGVLQARSIKFNPPLDSKRQDSIDKLGMGLHNKLILQFPSADPWGDDKRQGFAYFADGGPDPRGFGFTKDYGKWPALVNQYAFNKDKKILTFFVSGQFARDTEFQTTEELTESAMEALRAMFPGIPNATTALATRWLANPLYRGSYSHIPPGASGKTMDALLGATSHLLLAGEHTNHHRFAQTTGAWETGLSAANAIHALASGQATIDDVKAMRTAEHAENSRRWGAFTGKKTVENGLWGRRRGTARWRHNLRAAQAAFDASHE